jgi:release factor glutamine methyltransferase
MYFERLSFSEQIYIASKVLKKNRNYLMIYDFEKNSEMEEVAYLYLEKHKPLSKIFNEKYFYNKCFYVNENVLDPRPETEELINLIINNHHKKEELNIIDLGAGSGAIAITLAYYFTQSQVIGIDICPLALTIAQNNTHNHKINNIKFIQNDWLNNIENILNFQQRKYILVTNPPYLDEEDMNLALELQYDPLIALKETSFMQYYLLINQKKHLFSEIYMEFNYKNLKHMKQLFPNSNFHADIHGVLRFLVA